MGRPRLYGPRILLRLSEKFDTWFRQQAQADKRSVEDQIRYVLQAHFIALKMKSLAPIKTAVVPEHLTKYVAQGPLRSIATRGLVHAKKATVKRASSPSAKGHKHEYNLLDEKFTIDMTNRTIAILQAWDAGLMYQVTIGISVAQLNNRTEYVRHLRWPREFLCPSIKHEDYGYDARYDGERSFLQYADESFSDESYTFANREENDSTLRRVNEAYSYLNLDVFSRGEDEETFVELDQSWSPGASPLEAHGYGHGELESEDAESEEEPEEEPKDKTKDRPVSPTASAVRQDPPAEAVPPSRPPMSPEEMRALLKRQAPQ